MAGSAGRRAPLWFGAGPASPGACGLHLSDGNAWARAIGQLAQRLSLPDTAHLVIVVEAEPEDTDAGLADQPYPGSPHPLYGRFTALAWWPRSEWPADGRIHDGPLPAPGPAIAHWRKAPTPKQERAADLGVWAAPGVWSPSSACPVLGRHDRRYFAVCGKKPPRGPISLTDLFQHARGHLLLWTDRRYHLTPGSHLP